MMGCGGAVIFMGASAVRKSSIKHGLCMAVLLAFTIALDAEAKESCPPPVADPTPQQVNAAGQNARDHGFLWRISKGGHTSYLYGTMHIAKFEWVFPGREVTQALRATDTIALEIDPLDPDMKSRMDNGMKALRNTALPEPLAQRLRNLADTVCVPYAAVSGLAPELQLATLSMFLGREEGLEPSYAIDAILAAVGHGANKNVISLETPESQLKVLQMDTPQETISFVQSSLDEMDKGKGATLTARIGKAWGNSDHAEMSRYEEWCDCLNTDVERKTMRRLLDERNPNLADRIDALHKTGKKVFAAVGSLHMFGPFGLPLLMEKRGYKVARVDLKPL